MALEDYAKKRTFDKTPEPAGDTPQSAPQTRGGEFCVQRHRARRLHYDLRIQITGVMQSWAVPEGPSQDPSQKRLAVHTEDHPMEYSTFEGVIPEGNYGAGSMMLWDHGTYEVIGEPAAEGQVERGDFKFKLKGHKLRGDYVLVRTKQNNGKDWLLIKKKDEFAQENWDIDLYPLSVKSGRTQEEIAAGVETGLDRISGAKKVKMPGSFAPMMAFSVTRPPTDPGWMFEVKWDGVRALCHVEPGSLRMFSRNGNAIEKRYPDLAGLPEALKAQHAIVDGEIVALDSRGLPSFGMLQHRMHVGAPSIAATLARKTPATLYLFDLLYLDGWDLRQVAVEDRRRLLASIVTPTDRIKVSDHFIDQGAELFALAKQTGLEGIVAKRMGSVYESRRSQNWLKVKVTSQQEFVIAGYISGERDYFGALMLGLYDQGQLVYVGNVGSGFDNDSLRMVYELMQPFVTNQMPFQKKPEMLAEEIVWTRPELVCEVKYSNWTDEKRLRAPVFLGLRDDVSAKECIIEAEALQASEAKFVVPPPLLNDKREKVILNLEGRQLSFTNLNKIYYPAEKYAKRDLINYYHQVSDLILPYLKGRALSLRRYPDGIDGEGFFQKDASVHFPDWLRIEPIPSGHNEEPIRYVVCDDYSTLLFLTNLGCIDQNPWMSRLDSLENPDFLLIDLDPQHCDYDKIIEAAQLVRQKLDAVGLTGYPKTTGGDGMHIYVPLEPIYTYEQVRNFSQVIYLMLATERPDLFTTQRTVSKREKNRVYFDFAQLATGKTISAPYVLRAYPGAPVATPLEWREVRPGLTPQQFHLRNVLERFARVGDLFAGVLDKPQRLEGAMERLEKLIRR